MAMLIGIQIVGLVFGLIMFYFSYVYFKRNEFSPRDFIIWGGIWLVFIITILLPQKLNIFLDKLKIAGAMWFFTISGLLFLFALVFYLHVAVRRSQRKVEILVKKIALKKIK